MRRRAGTDVVVGFELAETGLVGCTGAYPDLEIDSEGILAAELPLAAAAAAAESVLVPALGYAAVVPAVAAKLAPLAAFVTVRSIGMIDWLVDH